jgi:hypothetical protein
LPESPWSPLQKDILSFYRVFSHLDSCCKSFLAGGLLTTIHAKALALVKIGFSNTVTFNIVKHQPLATFKIFVVGSNSTRRQKPFRYVVSYVYVYIYIYTYTYTGMYLNIYI